MEWKISDLGDIMVEITDEAKKKEKMNAINHDQNLCPHVQGYKSAYSSQSILTKTEDQKLRILRY